MPIAPQTQRSRGHSHLSLLCAIYTPIMGLLSIGLGILMVLVVVLLSLHHSKPERRYAKPCISPRSATIIPTTSEEQKHNEQLHLAHVTMSQEAEEGPLDASYRDVLTGLWTRAFFRTQVHRFNTPYHVPISIIMLDINGLRQTNNTYGLHVGDCVITRVSQVLRATARQDQYIARWGGDEFVMLLPHTDEHAAAQLGELIIQRVAQIPDSFVPISLAYGCASKNDSCQDLYGVLREAEERMYRRKLLESHSIYSSTISALSSALRACNHETEEHAVRMQQYCLRLGHRIGLSSTCLDELSLAAALHDIGKVGVNNALLQKAGPLTESEWAQMRKHTEIGFHIVVSLPEVAPIAQAILHHHEWWNGQGYPHSLQGSAIPLTSRILSILDAYDAMTHSRPYRQARSHQAALQELRRCAGTQFDPYLVEQFTGVLNQ